MSHTDTHHRDHSCESLGKFKDLKKAYCRNCSHQKFGQTKIPRADNPLLTEMCHTLLLIS